MTGGQGVGGSNPLAPTTAIAICLLALSACGPRHAQSPGDTSGVLSNETVVPADLIAGALVVSVKEDGSILIGEREIAEEQMVAEAVAAQVEDPGLKIILLVASSQIQAIHLMSLFYDAGFGNVTVYYPTSTHH